MSGRKSTEVNGMLARGKNARESGVSNFLGNILNAKRSLLDNQKDINYICDQINKTNINISNESKSEFPEESKELQDKYDAIKKQSVKVDYNSDIKAAENEQAELDNELKNADKKQESIRSRIKNKDWYCDEEYNEASKLVQIYKKISKKKNNLISKLKSKVQKSNQDVIKYQNLQKQMGQVVDAGNNLNEKSLKIVELRAKASDSKQYIKETFQKIDFALAAKFCDVEYKDLQDELDAFCALSDDEVIKNVNIMSEKISIFSSEVDQKYTEYLARVEMLESAIKANENSLKISSNFYFEPIDYYKNKDEATKIPLLDYLIEYSDKKELADSIKQEINKSKKLLDEEKFKEVETSIEKCADLINKANEYASILQEHMIENFYVAKDMTNVMKKMGFETGAYKIDGNIKNGWKISASNPNGENIDFTKVFVDDEGKMNIEIDHKTIGDCPSKWSDITAEFEEAGIYIENITMENGGVVVSKRGKNQENNSSNSESGNTVMQETN